ncbi:hypothetical protein LCM19_01875 [Qipengyuania flava]|nr:hypothetical protein [Qipengyuania flava]
MTNWQQRMAIKLVDASVALMPRENKEWADAMRAEIEAVEDNGEALEFALGCLWSSAKVRVLRVEFVVGVVRVGIPAGLSTLALLASYLSGRHVEAVPGTAAVFGVSSGIFAMAVALFLIKGYSALARLAGALIPIYLALLALTHLFRTPIADPEALSLYRALALEGVAMWSILLLITAFLARNSAMIAQHDRELRP